MTTRLFLCALLCAPAAAHAQIRASELASVSQTIDGTKITINYSRPRARSRDMGTLFGSPRVVHWDEVWTPGANASTTIEASKNIKLNGHLVPKGKYSVWMVVRKSGDWTAVLDTNAARFHTFRPDTLKAAVRFPIKVQQAPFMEVLTWWFPGVGATGGTIAMQWGTYRVDMDVMVEPSMTVPLTPAEAAPYVGRYEMTSKQSKKSRDFIISLHGDTLKAEWDKTDVGDGLQELLVKYFGRFALIRISKDWFVPGLYDEQGRIYEVLRPEMILEFMVEGGKATSFEIHDQKDEIWATAKRKN
jgi:hypothetical protein